MSEGLDSEIGMRLRRRREQEGLSLRELARKANLTAAFLSQVERGQTSISIASLQRVADALGVPIFHFLSGDRRQSPIVKANARAQITLPDSQITYELITPDLSRKVEVFSARMKPGARYRARQLREPTEQCILVLEGSLSVCLDEVEHVLNMGDSIYFDGDSLTEVACLSDDGVVWLGIITPPVL